MAYYSIANIYIVNIERFIGLNIYGFNPMKFSQEYIHGVR